MSDAYVPEPNSCHPRYASMADGIRSAIANGLWHVQVYEPPRDLMASFHAPGDDLSILVAEPKRRVLTVKKCAGPAPFVGDPRIERAMYMWRVAVDDLGRHVAGDATLEWGPAPL